MTGTELFLALAITIRVEGGLDIEEQRLVASELYARKADPDRWGQSWEQVLFRRHQYACWTDRPRTLRAMEVRRDVLQDESPEAWLNAVLLAELLVAGRFVPAEAVTHHHGINHRKPRSWACCSVVQRTEYHVWYIERSV